MSALASERPVGDDGPMHVVFDFGAVLFHWDPVALVAGQWPDRATDAVAAQALARDFFEGFGGDWAAFDRGTLDRDAVVAAIARRTGWEPERIGAVVDAVPRVLAADPATVAVVDDLVDAGVPVWFLSNMPAPYVPVLRDRQPLIGRLRGGLFSSHEGLVKPEAALFDRMVARFGLPPQRTVLVDDAPANVASARVCGWQAVLYRDAGQCRHDLRALGLPV
jgi:putative hydrolase of the HAD superfamily